MTAAVCSISEERAVQKGYFMPVEPDQYPDFYRRFAPAVTAAQLGNRTRFIALREIPEDDQGRLKDVEQTVDAYTDEFQLCDVSFPRYTVFQAPNYQTYLDQIQKRGLYLGDIWGFIIGSWPSPETTKFGEFELSDELDARLRSLGDHFLGYDNGEQDGRYIGSYAPGQWAVSEDRRKLYLGFQRFFEKHNRSQRNEMMLVASLTYLHYFAKDGTMTMLGAETAQGLPNTNLWAAYLRGASRQYGLLWQAEISVWNRWGYKAYCPEELIQYREKGPECGTSLSLMRRLIYLEYMYGASLLGCESNWLLQDPSLYDPSFFKKGKNHILTPIGILQEDCRRFTREHPDRGTLVTPVCLYLNYFNGFAPARHLYSKELYRVWGSQPYSEGDFQLHCIFELLYPGYEDAGFYRSEKGLLTATPFTDMVDILFSDVASQVLEQYEMAVVCGDGRLDAESQHKLERFAEKGGCVLLFGNKLEGLEKTLLCGEEDPVCLEENGIVLGRKKELGQGTVCNLMTAGIERSRAPKDVCYRNEENTPIPQPYHLQKKVREFLSELLDSYRLIPIDNRKLGCALNYLAPDHFLMTVTNLCDCREWFSLQCPDILSVAEWKVPDLPEDTPGYYVREAYRNMDRPGLAQGEFAVPADGIRILDIRTGKPLVEPKPPMQFKPSGLPDVYVKLNPQPNLKDAFLFIPWFDLYFAGVKAEASYFLQHDSEYLRQEAQYLKLRHCKIMVDFSELLNHYPGISLLHNVPGRTEKALEEIRSVLEKSLLFGCSKAIFTLQRNAENNLSEAEAVQRLQTSFAEISQMAGEMGITLYLQNGRSLKTRHVFSSAEDLQEFLEEGYLFAYHLAHGLGAVKNTALSTLGSVVFQDDQAYPESAAEIMEKMQPRALLLAAPTRDMFGRYCGTHKPLAGSGFEDSLREVQVPSDFICLDANYENADEIYRDYALLRQAFCSEKKQDE